MKRIRKFYEDHATVINAAAGVAGVITVVVLAKRLKGGDAWATSRPSAVDLWQLDGGGASMIVVKTKDGLSHQFIRELGDPSIVVAG